MLPMVVMPKAAWLLQVTQMAATGDSGETGDTDAPGGTGGNSGAVDASGNDSNGGDVAADAGDTGDGGANDPKTTEIATLLTTLQQTPLATAAMQMVRTRQLLTATLHPIASDAGGEFWQR
jgi:hypothetical protein